MEYLRVDRNTLIKAYRKFAPYCRTDPYDNEYKGYVSSVQFVKEDGSLEGERTIALTYNVADDESIFSCIGLSGQQLYYFDASRFCLKLSDSAVVSHSNYGRDVIPLLLPPRPIIALDSQGNEYNRAFFNNGGGLQEITGFLF